MKRGAMAWLLLAVTAAAGAPAAPGAAVSMDVVREVERSEVLTATGSLEANRSVEVPSQAAGVVRAVHAEVGRWVRRGAVLVELDGEKERLRVNTAQAALEQNEALLHKAQTDLDRASQLLASHDISKHEWETLNLRLTGARAGVEQAEAELSLARRALADTVIRSPFSGVVAARHVEVGSWVRPGQPVAQIVDLARMKAQIAVPQGRIGALREGMAVEVTVDSLPGRVLSGRVSRIGVVADRQSGQFTVEITVPQLEGHLLRPGLAARLRIPVERRVVVVPSGAVLDSGDAQAVLVAGKDGHVHRVPVTVGGTVDGGLELIHGELAPGDRVITSGKEGLADGDPVPEAGSGS